jgi:four helix bundle protein
MFDYPAADHFSRFQASGIRNQESAFRMSVQSYRDLQVWQKAMDLVVACYQLTAKLPQTEIYGLASDIQRKARQIPSYIADGHGRGQTAEYLSRLSLAHGSMMALETDLLTADRLSFLTMEEIEPLLSRCAEVGRMLHGLMRSLRSSHA